MQKGAGIMGKRVIRWEMDCIMGITDGITEGNKKYCQKQIQGCAKKVS